VSTGPNPIDGLPTFPWASLPPRPKFRHRYVTHLILFVLTFITTTFSGALGSASRLQDLLTLGGLAAGLWYSIPVLLILSAHEFGHYFACRYYNVDATLPYFIPAPIPLTGTLGAVIRIREPFPSRRALFDIGVAGPIGGFVVLVPLLLWAMAVSTVGPVPDGAIYFGEPLLFKLLEWLYFGVIPAGMDVLLHPVGIAAWWGMLATALNLLPFGQLDGGHLTYAVMGRRAAIISGAVLIFLLILSTISPSWIVPTVLLSLMSVSFGFRHPPTLDDQEPLDGDRRLVAVIAAIIFALCFTPIPIAFVGQ
jgi:membrane-associated protease RseP (regulator of RpoE activity)